jgi:hypothetical protein
MICPEEIDYTYVKMPPKKKYTFEIEIREVKKGEPGKYDLDEWS